MWLWGYEMTTVGDSSDTEMLYTTVLCTAKPGARSNAEGMHSERKVPPPSPPMPPARTGEPEPGAIPCGRTRQEGSGPGRGIRIQKWNRQFPSRRVGAR